MSPAVASISRVLFPRLANEKALIVLSAYFDDSGTHTDSDVVVLAGFIGDEQQWIALKFEWKQKLEEFGISSFHLSSCQARRDQFEYWTKNKIDHAVYEFRSIIIRQKLMGIATAVSHHDWDELVFGLRRQFWGDAEQFCFKKTIDDATTWAKENAPHETELALVFDARFGVGTRFRGIGDMYLRYYSDRQPELLPFSYVPVEKFQPLQAADMLACWTYRYAKDALSTGRYPEAAAEFARLLETGRLGGGIMDREMIEQMNSMVGFKSS